MAEEEFLLYPLDTGEHPACLPCAVKMVLSVHDTATFGQLPVTESVVLPPMGMPIMKVSEKYRLKALACERIGRDVPNRDFKNAWAEIAIEWHALAARRAHEDSEYRDLEIN